MSEYNLTWTEAKEAMRRGAICNNNYGLGRPIRYKIEDGHFKYESRDGLWVCTGEFLESGYQRWRIVEVPPLSARAKTLAIEMMTKQVKEESSNREVSGLRGYVGGFEGVTIMSNDQKYPLSQAVDLMKGNRFMMSTGGVIYKIKNNSLYRRVANRWHPVTLSVREFDTLYHEVPNPEKPKGNALQLSGHDLWPDTDGNDIELDREYFWAENANIADKWNRGISTLMRLKAHQLAKKFNPNKRQYHISVLHENDEVHVFPTEGQSNYAYATMFDTEADAWQAARDIQYHNIINMFKTFGGIYE